MLFIVIAIFAICWLPFQAYNILQEIYPSINDYKYINLIWFSCHLFAMSNSCYNPFIYSIYGEKFNQEFRQRFYCCCFWASRVNGAPATPTTIHRSMDHMTSQVTHLNDPLTPRHSKSIRRHNSSPFMNSKNGGSSQKSPASRSSSTDNHSLLSGRHDHNSANGNSHELHIVCRKKAHLNGGKKSKPIMRREVAVDEVSGNSSDTSERKGLRESLLNEKKEGVLLNKDNRADSKVSYV